MLCLADIASSEKKCNLMVFDEFEAGLDNVSKKIMAEDMIPLLHKRVPSMYLITHNLDIPESEFDGSLKVIRENNRSIVVTTHKANRSKDNKQEQVPNKSENKKTTKMKESK
jgi:ABC-type nitrate/sulfonate/bicarbonate transport system ATPase subunit